VAATVLLVDDEPTIRASLSRALEKLGYLVEVAIDGQAAVDRLRRGGVDLLLTDVSMPRMGGLQLLETLREESLRVPSLVMSGAAAIPDAVRAVQLGATDYIEKPVQTARLELSMRRCLELDQLRQENQELRTLLEPPRLLGESAPMVALCDLVATVGRSDGRALIAGEHGTGKNLVARALHHASPRATGPFVTLNCSAVPENLVESELFGHERGAFTGAHRARRGRFELAHAGTLFLDEIGDMPASMQPKLLRVLQEGTFVRVGGTRVQTADVRVIAATHRDLESMMTQGTFREDLYYRLHVVRLDVPPLRTRLEDVPILARAFLDESARRHRRPTCHLTHDAMARLRRYPYPGNVRELENLVERLVILADGAAIDASAVAHALGDKGVGYEGGRTLSEHLESYEVEIIRAAVRTHGSRAAAARALGVERSFFYKKCKRLQIVD
jgi:two-component system response regulator HydG